MMHFGKRNPRAVDDLQYIHEFMNFYAPHRKQSRTLIVRNQTLPGNVTIGNLRDIW